MAKRAPFILIEGLDRSGKTTQTSVMHARLEAAGIPSKLFKFPDRTTPIGQIIDSYLRSQSELDDRSIHLLFSANRWELASTIEDLLNSGTAVLCDRYAFSGIAFSTSKGISYEWCRAPDISLPAPDLTIFLDISPEKAKERGGYGEERYEKEEMQRKVREVFMRIGAEMTSSSSSSSNSSISNHGTETKGGKWVNVDAGRGREAVSEDLWNIVGPLLEGLESPIGRLWTGIQPGTPS